jgi:hypothetical protein
VYESGLSLTLLFPICDFPGFLTREAKADERRNVRTVDIQDLGS